MRKDDAIATPGIANDPSPAHVAHVYAVERDAGADHAEAVANTIAAFNRYKERLK